MTKPDDAGVGGGEGGVADSDKGKKQNSSGLTFRLLVGLACFVLLGLLGSVIVYENRQLSQELGQFKKALPEAKQKAPPPPVVIGVGVNVSGKADKTYNVSMKTLRKLLEVLDDEDVPPSVSEVTSKEKPMETAVESAKSTVENTFVPMTGKESDRSSVEFFRKEEGKSVGVAGK